MFSGEYKNKINQIGVQKTGVPKMQNTLKTNDLCGATYDYLDLQNGRIYNFQGSLKYVQGDSAIGSYFFQNGAHDKFGVPKTDENVSLFFYSQEFFNRVSIQLYWPGSAYATKPLDEIYCPGQEPVCGNGKVENKESCDPKEDKQCSLDCKIKCDGLKVWDSRKKECVKEPVCGDGEVDTGEVCDDGNIVDGDQCSLDCKNVCDEPEVWSGGKVWSLS